MNNLIEKSKAVDVLRNMNAIVSPISDDVLLIDKAEAMTKLMLLPPAQSEVIHCKDCEWWTKQDKSLQGRCELMQVYPTGEWFCGNAQKKVTDGRNHR